MKHVAACVLLTGVATVVFAGDGVPTPELSAAQIVEKNIAVRGGLEAWHNIQTMVWIGHIETANAPLGSRLRRRFMMAFGCADNSACSAPSSS